MRFSSNCMHQTCVNKEELLTLNKFLHDCQANVTQKRVDIINTIWSQTYYCFCIIINLILALLSCRKQRFYNLNRWSYSVFVAAQSMLYLCLPFWAVSKKQNTFPPTKKGFYCSVIWIISRQLDCEHRTSPLFEELD